MQIQLLQNHQIDKARWLRTIQQSPNGLIYAWPNYLDTMSPVWQALATEDYSLLMPLTIKKKWGIRYLYQPPWCQQLGVFGTATMDIETIQEFLKVAQQHLSFAEINLNYQNGFTADTLFPRKNYVLPLAEDYATIRSQYTKGLIKKDLERVEKYNLQYSVSTAIETTITIYKEWYASRTPHVTEKDYVYFTQLCRQLQTTGNAFVREVRLPNNELLACNIFLKDSNRIYYILSATLPNGRTLGANHFLLDQLIQEFAGSNLLLDFEGSEISTIERIFQKFGATNQPYFFTKWNSLPWPLRLLKK